MDIFFVIIMVFLAFRNGQAAKLKGKNQVLWVTLTIVTFIVLQTVGMLVVLFSFYKGNINWAEAQRNQAYLKDALSHISEQIYANPVQLLTIYLFGLGGYLLMRFLLERIPDKKKHDDNTPGEQDINWMDKYKRQEEQ